MKINQYGVLFQPSLIRNLKHSMSFNCHYTFGIGADFQAPDTLLPGLIRRKLPGTAGCAS